jgi:hypothetical protein
MQTKSEQIAAYLATHGATKCAATDTHGENANSLRTLRTYESNLQEQLDTYNTADGIPDGDTLHTMKYGNTHPGQE